MIDFAERMKDSGGVCILIAVSDSLSIVVSSGTKRVDSSAILKGTMAEFGGRGGGKADFAQGGMPDVSRAENVRNRLLLSVEAALKQEN